MKPKLLPSAIVIAVLGAVSVAGTVTAGAGDRADTTVTIRTENGDFWGTVSSPRPRKCAEDRKVVLFKRWAPSRTRAWTSASRATTPR